MTTGAMVAVKSRLRLLLADKNKERAELGMNAWRVRELAEAAKVSPSVITAFVKGDVRRFDASTLDGLCRALDCQVGDILVFDPSVPQE